MNERMKRTAAMIEHAVLKLAKEAREPRGTATTVGHTIGRLAAHGVGIRIRGGGPHRINDLQLDVELYQGRTTAPNPRLRLRWDEENEIPSIAWQNAEQGTRITMLPAGAAHDEKLLGPEAPDTRLLPTGQWAAETLASLWTPLAVLWKDKAMQPAICRTPDLVTLERLATETDHALRLISAWSVIGERRLAQLAVELGRKQGASLTLWWNDDGDGAQNAGPQQVRLETRADGEGRFDEEDGWPELLRLATETATAGFVLQGGKKVTTTGVADLCTGIWRERRWRFDSRSAVAETLGAIAKSRETANRQRAEAAVETGRDGGAWITT